MRKIILIGLFLLLAWPSSAQRTATYTSFDGVLQVEYMRGWRIGTVEPDMENIDGAMLRTMPSSYLLTLYHSRPDAEIHFYAIDAATLIPDDEDPLEFLQASIAPEIEFTTTTLGENEAIEFNVAAIPSLAMGRTRIDLSGARRFIVTVGRNNWLLGVVLIADNESLDEEFTTIAESFHFNGSNRNILSLTGNIRITLPQNWFRSANFIESRKQWETINLRGVSNGEFCPASIEIIDLASAEFDFPEEGSNDDYLEAFLNRSENHFEPLDIYAEHLAEGISLYMTEADDDYRYLSLQVLEEHLVISYIYLGDGLCIDDYFSMINSVEEE